MKKIYKCKSCGGNLSFNPDHQNLICDHCKSQENIILQNKPQASQIQYSPKLNFNQSINMGGVFKCLACETKIAYTSNTPLTRCPSCGNKELNQINESQIHPMNIIPFQITKKQASAYYKKWISSRKFAPNNLKKMAKQQKLSGFYAPVYMFDFDATTHYSAHGIDESKRADGSISTFTSYINDVEHSFYDDYLHSANRKVPSDLFRNMGGFNPNGIVPYSDEYILGFMGLGTNRTIHSSLDLVEEEISELEARKIKSKLNRKFDDIDFFRSNTTISKIWCDYLYVPVWANHYTYKGKDYHCYINGQTGKVTGKSPKSFWKILGFITLIFAGAALFAWLLK